jgi:hypothetical protein
MNREIWSERSYSKHKKSRDIFSVFSSVFFCVCQKNNTKMKSKKYERPVITYFNFLNSRVHLPKYTLSTKWIHDFIFMNLRFQFCWNNCTSVYSFVSENVQITMNSINMKTFNFMNSRFHHILFTKSQFQLHRSTISTS